MRSYNCQTVSSPAKAWYQILACPAGLSQDCLLREAPLRQPWIDILRTRYNVEYGVWRRRNPLLANVETWPACSLSKMRREISKNSNKPLPQALQPLPYPCRNFPGTFLLKKSCRKKGGRQYHLSHYTFTRLLWFFLVPRTTLTGKAGTVRASRGILKRPLRFPTERHLVHVRVSLLRKLGAGWGTVCAGLSVCCGAVCR